MDRVVNGQGDLVRVTCRRTWQLLSNFEARFMVWSYSRGQGDLESWMTVQDSVRRPWPLKY